MINPSVPKFPHGEEIIAAVGAFQSPWEQFDRDYRSSLSGFLSSVNKIACP